MIIIKKIESLEDELAKKSDFNSRANTIIELLESHINIHSKNGIEYADELLFIGKKVQNNEYIIKGNRYKAYAALFHGYYNMGIQHANEMLQLSEDSNNFESAIDAINILGNIYYSQGLYNESIIMHERALKGAESISDQIAIAMSHHGLGVAYGKLGNYDDELLHYSQSLEIKEKYNERVGIADICTSIGINLSMKGEYSKALDSHYRALKIKEELGDQWGIAYSNNCLAFIFYTQENYVEALQRLQFSLAARKRLGDDLGLAEVYNNIGLIEGKCGNTGKSLANLFEAQKIYVSLGNPIGIAKSHLFIGVAYYEHLLYSLAIENLEIALHDFRRMGSKEQTAVTLVHLGNCYLQLKNHTLSEQYLFQGIKLAREIGLKDEVKEALKSLSELEKLRQNFEQALIYREEYFQLEKQLTGAEMNQKIRSVEIKIEQDKNSELKTEKEISERILYNIFPSHIADRLKQVGKIEPESFENVSILFTDFKDYTILSEKLDPLKVVSELHECFKVFDEIIVKYKIEKIKTIGDAYMAVSGLFNNQGNQAEDIVNAALEIRDFMINRKKQIGENAFEIRIGINSGSVIAGVIGANKYAYDVWGDSVNLAARLEHESDPGKINIGETTYQQVRNKFRCLYRGELPAKNKGLVRMYFVERL